MPGQTAVSITQQEVAFQIAHSHVQATKKWEPADYSLEFLRVQGDPGTPIIVLDAVHKDDLVPGKRGGGESVQLHVDVQGRTVVNELAYQ